MNNANTVETNWSELKGKIKNKWSKFSDSEVEGFKGNLGDLSGKIQKVYGVAKDQADQQSTEFTKSVQSLVGPSTVASDTSHTATAGASTTASSSTSNQPKQEVCNTTHPAGSADAAAKNTKTV